jgi:rare lipoprotein A
MTAAHRTLPLPSIVRVTNLENGRSALIRVNDRGPYAKDRIIDLSKASADKLGVVAVGTARVRVQFLEQQTKEYVQNSSDNGMKYAMNKLQDEVPAQATAVQVFCYESTGWAACAASVSIGI